jgi:diguanylate cyclase (GGDEF)-like protein
MNSASVTAPADFQGVYASAPVSLWIEDYSGIKALFDRLRADGIADLALHLETHPEVVDAAMRQIRVLDVNDYTLKLFKAQSKSQFLARLGEIFRGDMRSHFAAELTQMWSGDLRHETEGVNYALDGTPLDILLSRCALPGHEEDWSRALVSIVDISERKRAGRALAASNDYAQGLFEHSPVSLWVEDYTGIKRLFSALRERGVTDLARHLRSHPDFVQACIASIRVLDVNQRTLALFRAPSKEALIKRLDHVFGKEMSAHFAEELLDMWTGRMLYECEGVNYTLAGEPIDIHLQRSVLPGHEETWARVLISITDISARKKAEAYMKFLGTHDVLTGLHNRAYFDDAVQRLGSSGYAQTSIVIADLNGLKQANDALGHTAGDSLIRRAAEVLQKAVAGADGDSDSGDFAARIGGDEFALLLRGKDERGALQAIERIRKLIDVNNQFYQGPPLSMSLGAATCDDTRTFAQAYKEADDRMYQDKRSRRR